MCESTGERVVSLVSKKLSFTCIRYKNRFETPCKDVQSVQRVAADTSTELNRGNWAAGPRLARANPRPAVSLMLRSFARGLAGRSRASKRPSPPPRSVAAARAVARGKSLGSALPSDNAPLPPPHGALAGMPESTRPAQADDASASGRTAYREYWEALVQREWEHELSMINEQLESWPVARLEKEGLCASGLVGSGRAYRFYNRPVARFTLRDEAPRHSFQPGDEIVLSRANPLTEIDALRGEIIEIARDNIEIALVDSGQVRRRAIGRRASLFLCCLGESYLHPLLHLTPRGKAISPHSCT